MIISVYGHPIMTDQNRFSAGILEPEFYSELLRFREVSSWNLVDPYHLNDEEYISGISDDRMCRFLDTIARVVVSRPDRAAAVTASQEQVEISLHTTLYVAFDRDPEELDSVAIRSHIPHLLDILRRIPKLDPGQEILIDKDNEWIFWELSKTIHGFCFDRLMFILNKHQEALQQTAQAVVQDRVSTFTPAESEALTGNFGVFRALARIQKSVQESVEVGAKVIGLKYEEWIAKGYLVAHVEDPGGKEKTTLASISKLPLFDKVQRFMESKHGIHFALSQWIREIAGYHLDCVSLVNLRRSHRFQPVIEGSLTLKIIPALAPRCERLTVDLSHSTIVEAVRFIRGKFCNIHIMGQLLNRDKHDEPAAQFIDHLEESLDKDSIGRGTINSNPCVHCEISMIHYMRSSGAPILPYMGVSKPTCSMCKLYLRTYAQVFSMSPVGTPDSRHEFCAGWVFPASRGKKSIMAKLLVAVQGRFAAEMENHINSIYIRRYGSIPTARVPPSGSFLYKGV
ncbi:hypothetical protein C8J56DRAFT_979546 [Mycena floridula]|nr:hypothetical protein C8J56DRAFT_979546 [Mycena floridula]